MLYPQVNKYRNCLKLNDIWDIKFDYKDEGDASNFKEDFDDGVPIAVPASWNEQFAEERDFLGPAWYKTYFTVPTSWTNDEIYIRFGSVNYLADTWLNGELIGKHEGGHLPFEFKITEHLNFEENILIVKVDGRLSETTVPPIGRMNFPSTNFDFFPYCGIHRPVVIYSKPNDGIQDISVQTDIKENQGVVKVVVRLENPRSYAIQCSLTKNGFNVNSKADFEGEQAEVQMIVADPYLWTPETPNLYKLKVELVTDSETFDAYSLNIGIRTIIVEGDEILLNGKTIKLNGFGRHEDFHVIGRGYMPSLIIKDYSIMKWLGANSFRTSHYPYSEQMMDLADRLGFLVIDEIPAVGLKFGKTVDKQLEMCKQYIEELIHRDKNHPSVIIWSLANEPHASIKSKQFFKELCDLTKNLDPTRLITIVSMIGTGERAFEFCDITCMNRYNGWYYQSGEIDKGMSVLSEELDNIHEKYQKPLLLSEFGADTIPGCHAQPPEMFSEEYQVELVKNFIEVAESKPYIIGHHIWNLCDFKTGQGLTRMGGYNYKGVFTRDRRPKMVAHYLKKIWTCKDD